MSGAAQSTGGAFSAPSVQVKCESLLPLSGRLSVLSVGSVLVLKVTRIGLSMRVRERGCPRELAASQTLQSFQPMVAEMIAEENKDQIAWDCR